MLVVPPFAEEMNKARRQFSLTADVLIERGFAVLLFDPYGTGDSSGEFAEATWELWISDVCTVMEWGRTSGFLIDGVVAARLGCVLAAQGIRRSGLTVRKSVFWQPVADGRRYMAQFLRLRVAASMMASGRRETVEGLRKSLAKSGELEVAGYALSESLWRGVEGVNLSENLDGAIGDLTVFEIGLHEAGNLSPAGRRLLEDARGKGIDANGSRIAGDPFWSSTETVVNRDLANLTATCFSD